MILQQLKSFQNMEKKSKKVKCVIGPKPGPTTKADILMRFMSIFAN